MKKQPQKIKQHIDNSLMSAGPNGKPKQKAGKLKPSEIQGNEELEAMYQEQLEAEALDLSPGEITEQNGSQGSASAINRSKRAQLTKYMQSECERLTNLLHKHDPVKKLEKTL